MENPFKGRHFQGIVQISTVPKIRQNRVRISSRGAAVEQDRSAIGYMSMVDRYQLDESIERGLFLLPEVPGELTLLAVPGVQGRKITISHRIANNVGAATLNEHTADAAIQKVIEVFAAEGKTFGWRIGPYSTPKDLDRRLLAAGFEQVKRLSGLYIADWQDFFQIPNGISIRQASPADRHLLEELIRETYPVHSSWSDTMSKALLPRSNEGGSKITVFMAFVEEREKPVGMASMYWFPDRPVVFLAVPVQGLNTVGKGFIPALCANGLPQLGKMGRVRR